MKSFNSEYNTGLQTALNNFQAKNNDTIEGVSLFDTQPVFNALLDSADALGYVNVTGWCTAYENGIGDFGMNNQVDGCAPVASYL
jgi:phospholipase/lecithinase/hemolysin